jgi:hypothetical protein
VPRQFRYRKKPDEVVELFWQEGDALTIQATKAIYLLRRRRTREILYIGKASRQSVGGRWLCPSKGRLHKLAKQEHAQMCPLVAGLHTSRRITAQLIGDVERLLIFLLNPRWNGPGKLTCRLHHRELVVRCSGEWPHRRALFTYLDEFPFKLEYSSS